MKKAISLVCVLFLCLMLAGCGKVVYTNPYLELPKPVAILTMESGLEMRFTLDPAAAPNTVANFINLANSGFYDGLKIDYIYPTYFMRGGDPNGDGTGGTDYSIEGEFAENGFKLDGLTHKRGVLSMCRYVDDPNSASSQFFIMLGTHSEYDGQYAAFGYIEPNDALSFEALDKLTDVSLDKSYRPLLKQTIVSIRVPDTGGYTYNVIKYKTKDEG